MFLPFTAQVTLAQDYLPNRPGTASGLSLGVAIAAGGLCAPLLGWLADVHGLPTTIWVLVAVFAAPTMLAFSLTEPRVALPDLEDALSREGQPTHPIKLDGPSYQPREDGSAARLDICSNGGSPTKRTKTKKENA